MAIHIDGAARSRIEAAVAKARETPVPLAWVMAQARRSYGGSVGLADRPEGFRRPPSRSVDLCRAHRANFSFEEQPSGLVAHLSVSVGTPAVVPASDDLLAIAAAFGYPGQETATSRAWTEEFAPGEMSVHLVWLDPGTGHPMAGTR